MEPLFFGLELPVLLALVGSFSVLIVGAVVFTVLLRRDMSGKRKVQGLAGAADIDAEATRDYQVSKCTWSSLLILWPRSRELKKF